MTEKYIIVKVRDADREIPTRAVAERGKVVIPSTSVGHLRKAIHAKAAEQFISEADIVTHTQYMSQEDSDTVARIFERAMKRAKEGHERGWW